MSDLAAAFRRLVELHREIGSRIPEYLRLPASDRDLDQAEERWGSTLHPDIRALYKLADGVDTERWYVEPRVPPWLVPDAEFPSLTDALRNGLSLRRIAKSGGDGDRIWRESWFPVLLLGGAEVLAVDSADAHGEVWIVRWEADKIAPIAPDLAALLQRATDRMRNYRVSTAEDGFTLVLPPSDPAEGWY